VKDSRQRLSVGEERILLFGVAHRDLVRQHDSP
jgi:hypothetical protein